jgi:hypothetical protein
MQHGFDMAILEKILKCVNKHTLQWQLQFKLVPYPIIREYIQKFDGKTISGQKCNLVFDAQTKSFNTKKENGNLPNWVINIRISGDSDVQIYRNKESMIEYKICDCFARYSYNTGLFTIGSSFKHKNPHPNCSWQE